MGAHAAAQIGEVIAEQDEFVETKTYAGPCRRESTMEERVLYAQKKRLRIEMMNRLGRWALGIVCAVVIAGVSWVLAEFRTKMQQTEELRIGAASSTAEIKRHTDEITQLRNDFREEAHRRRVADDEHKDREMKLLLELQTLNSQVAAVRMERARESQGARR